MSNSTHEQLSACPLCGVSLQDRPANRLGDYSRDHLLRCARCSFVFSSAVPSDEDYARVYGAYDYAAEDAARTAINIEKERGIAARLVGELKTGRVLDIAAGAGRFLERFQELGFECYATEFDEKMQDYLRSKGFKVLPGGVLPEAPEDGMFDIVVFTEIVEHINIPVPVLERIHRLLRPGGRLYITTPNFNSLERRVLKQDWGMICWPEHISYWTPVTLNRLLRDRGFRKQWMVVENVSLFRVVQALKKGRLGSALSGVSEQAVSDAAQRGVSGNKFLSAAKTLVNAALTRSRLGCSIKAIYVKPETR